ncbi:MAG TPA: hypothetical protein VFA39_15600 [Steroidobacteraceae bacterium]|nr:hypothetical protein [Steroidobacteraceae bacterium]
MPRDGSGNYSAPAGQPVQTGTTISSTIFNNLVSDVVAALTASIARNGETTPTANLPMGGFKHTGVADGSARNHYASVGQTQDDAASVISAIAGTDTITGALTPSISAYTAGMTVTLVPIGNNTGAATLALNGLSAKSIVKYNGTALSPGDLVTGEPAYLVYAVAGGGRWTLLNPQKLPSGQVSGLGTLATQNGTFSNAALINAGNIFTTLQFLKANGEQIRLGDNSGGNPYISWYRLNGSTRIGYMQGLESGALAINAELSNLTLTSANVIQLAGVDVTYGGVSIRNAGIINAGQFADAQIRQSNVTQHQTALALNGNQITVGTVSANRLPLIGSLQGVTIASDPGTTPSGSAGQIFFYY